MRTTLLFFAGIYILSYLQGFAQNNVYYGPLAGQNGYYNSNFGLAAGYQNTGDENVFVGYYAGFSNTTADWNSFLGAYAGYSNTTGSGNNFVGYGAGMLNTTGYYNNFFGYYAGGSNTTGANNVFVGSRAGAVNKTGNYNHFVGVEAGQANTTGYQNNFFGYRSGYSNTTGYGNSFYGHQSGNKNTTGNLNTSMGYEAGYSNTSGGANTSLGNRAGKLITTGARNTMLASQAGENTTGSENVFVGHKAGLTNTTGTNNTALGTYAGPGSAALTNSSAIGHRAKVTASNAMVLGSINGQNGATATIKVGIGTTAPGYNLQVNGTAAKSGSSTWTVISDERLKQDVSEFQDGLAILQKIQPVWFRYNGKAQTPTDKKYIGVIAQRMQKIAPYTVGEFTYEDETGKQEKYLDYDASALTYVLVNSVKEVDQKYAQQLKDQQALILSQQQQITTLQRDLETIKTLLRQGNALPSAEEGAARLWQNEPNPTNGATVIRFFIPSASRSAQIKIFTTTGQEVRSIDIQQRGEGQIELSGESFSSGVYVYHLLVNGQSVASKKLVAQK